MKIIIALLVIALLVISCQKRTPKEVQSIDPNTFAQKLKSTKNAQLVDVRTPEEFQSGHLANAANIDWYEDDFANKMATYDKSKPVFVYCKAGIRGKKAANKLAELGFNTIYNLEGGIDKWNQMSLERTEQSQTDTTK